MSVALVRGEVRFVSIVTFTIDPRSLRGLVPVGTEVNTFDDGQAPLSVVGLRFAENHLLGLPVPFASCYDQIQLRFYVRRKMGRNEWRRGMVHVRDLLPVSSFLSAGHVLYGEAYQRLPVTSRVRPPDPGRPARAAPSIAGAPTTTSSIAWRSTSPASRTCRSPARARSSWSRATGATCRATPISPASTASIIRRGACGRTRWRA